MPRTSLLHSRALPPAKVIGELEVRWCRSVVWLGQDSDSDSFNEHAARMVEVKHIVFMHADRNTCRPTQRPCITRTSVFRVQVVDCNWDETAGCAGGPAVALSHPDRPRLFTATSVRTGRCSWSLTRPEREART